MSLLRLIRSVVLYIRYTTFEFDYIDDLARYRWELKQRTDVPLKYRRTTFFLSRTKIGCIYQAIKKSRYIIIDIFKHVP